MGIPRALNMYENYPFWHAFFTRLGFSVQLSDQSSKKTYQAGIESMPSESVCYPAKMSHGHVMNLIDRDVDFIWMPCVRWERKEDPTAGNCYNCPIVMSYPTALALNIDEIREQNIEFLYPFVPYHDKTELKRRHVVLDDIPGYPEDYFAVEDDLARASALLAKRRVPETRGFEKLVRFLMGKGFSYHIAADAVKARLDAECEECAL